MLLMFFSLASFTFVSLRNKKTHVNQFPLPHSSLISFLFLVVFYMCSVYNKCVHVCLCALLTMVLKLSCLGRRLLQDKQSAWQSLHPGSHKQSSRRATTVFMVQLSAAKHRTEQICSLSLKTFK